MRTRLSVQWYKDADPAARVFAGDRGLCQVFGYNRTVVGENLALLRLRPVRWIKREWGWESTLRRLPIVKED